jgi:hypothetical protein
LDYNIGDEATVYLEYIINHYHDRSFSPYTAFVHGHEFSWHHRQSFLNVLSTFNYGYYHYMSVNYDGLWQCLHKDHWQRQHWNMMYDHLIAPWRGFINYDNTVICDHCCAQFVVTRERILAQPIEIYQHALLLSSM